MTKLYFLLFCLYSPYLLAQGPVPEPFIISSDTIAYQNVPAAYWQLIEDTSSGKWTIGTVSSPPVSNFFHANSSVENIPGRPVNTYWIRFKLKNNLVNEVSIVLQQKSAYADFYIRSGAQNWIHKTTGENKPWSERDGYKQITAVPFSIKPGEEISVFERIVFDYRFSRPKPLEAGFGFSGQMVEEDYVDNDAYLFKIIIGSMLIGLLFFAGIFNFFFFLVAHERVYLYYALCLLIGTINEYHNIFFHIFFRDHPALLNTNAVFFLVLVNYFAIQMERYFLNTFSHFPRWDKILLSSVYIQFLALIAVYFVGPHLPNHLDSILWTVWDAAQGIVLICLLTTFLLFLRRKDKSARQFIIACLPVASIWVANYIIMNVTKGTFAIEWNKYYARIEFVCIASLVIILSWILFDRYNLLRKENAERAVLNERLAKEKEIERSQLIARQKVVLEQEVAERTAELKQSLEDLKAAQKQLIQSEKMASLGQLTAGIAHEIQNPLNFVNNFSEVTAELLEELKDGPLTTLKDEYKAVASEVIEDLSQNLQKIQHHGHRAEAIVKAMLQHSSGATGTTELTNINTLTEKYLAVAYSGLIAKDKRAHVKLVTDFDESIDQIEVIPQEIGRVLVNLFDNAFYFVGEKKKQQDGSYEPTVSVSTKRLDEAVQICVSDNGVGIPQKIVDKIFQPFFTTKPTGQGTGLGLSLSYDIIKAHGGELKVETKGGEGAEFVIELPAK